MKVMTKAEPENKFRVVSPGSDYISQPTCAHRTWGPTLRVEHSISALSKAFCRDSTVALRSSNVSRRVSMMTWLSLFSFSGVGGGVEGGEACSA